METKTENHRTRALDGLRGIAILMVMFHHFARVPQVSAAPEDVIFYRILHLGWTGVDLFFALSGFLITGILLRTKYQESYFKSFYGRRVLRIFPLYYFYLFCTFVILLPLIHARLSVDQQQNVAATMAAWPWFLLYLSNIKQAMTGVFLSGNVGHLWSISIEEQFYLIWPLVVLLTSARRLFFVCVVLLVAGLIARSAMAWSSISPSIIYVFTPVRLDSLLAGSLAAICVHVGWSVRLHGKLIVLATTSIAACLFALGSAYEGNAAIYTIGFCALAAISACAVYYAATDENAGTTILGSRTLVFFGKYSYALYLFNTPVSNLMTRIAGTPRLIAGSQIPWQIAFTLAGTAVAVLMSLASWQLIEKHFLSAKDRLFPAGAPRRERPMTDTIETL